MTHVSYTEFDNPLSAIPFVFKYVINDQRSNYLNKNFETAPEKIFKLEEVSIN